jgi:redox-sensitive bicupin YhaK (pirin superfamily)
MQVLRSAERFTSVQPGIVTRHCFSAGPHYDPDRLGVGALIGVDEHRLEPGAGFGSHAHRGVDIVSRVVTGTLRHEDDAGRVRLVVPPVAVQVQTTGSGIRHREVNATDTEPLILIQMTLVGGTAEPGYRCTFKPVVTLPGGTLIVLGDDATVEAPLIHAFVVTGSWTADGTALRRGDSVAARTSLGLAGSGEMLVWKTGRPF